MNDTAPHMPSEENADLLISRMIDGEASPEDERAFERLAEVQPQLWRDLATRQRDAAQLARAADRQLALADRVSLPHRATGSIAFPHAARRHGGWLFASAGWAAAITLLLLWRLAAPGTMNDATPTHIQNAAQLTPDEQLRSYLRAPYVLGELDPLMERVDTLPDGRIAVVAQRRIQEVLILDENDALPVDEQRYFMRDPAELRAESIH